jgi:GT2 family glycosyltransferase
MASSPSSDSFVTIAIPTFNRSSWLQGCIAASLRQSYANFEIVVSDNASTDATQDVLRGFASEKLRVIRQEENIGLVANWNACWRRRRDRMSFLSPTTIPLRRGCWSAVSLSPAATRKSRSSWL